MVHSTKSVRFSGHALEQLKYRGTTAEEVTKAVQTMEWAPAELGRLECRMNMEFDKEWNNKYYHTKQVRPIFVEEMDEIVVVTVYVYYF
jgi:hypothetical protein